MAVIANTLEVQGYRLGLNDNLDGTFSFQVTLTTAGTDPTIEIQSYRCRIHPTGDTTLVGGVSYLVYAVVVVSV